MVFWSTYFSTRHFKTCISHTVPLPSLCKTRSLQKKTSLKRRQPFWETVNFFRKQQTKKLHFSVEKSAQTGKALWMLVNTWKPQAFTLETYENQWETHSVWRGEGFFRSFKCVYTRAKAKREIRSSATSKSRSMHHRRTIFFYSPSW